MTIKKQSKSDSRNYVEPRDQGKPIRRDRSERNLRNMMHSAEWKRNVMHSSAYDVLADLDDSEYDHC